MNLKISLLVLASFSLSACKTVDLRDYFPPNEALKISTYRDKHGLMVDSLRCNSLNRPIGLSGLGVGSTKNNSGLTSMNFCYCFSTGSKDSVSTSGFFETRGYRFESGSYYMGKHGLYVSYFSSLEEIESAGTIYLYKMLPSRIKMFKSYEFRLYKDFPQFYEFLGFEDVQTEKKIFPKCLKLKISGSLQYGNDTEFVWLFKDAGIVKKQLPNEVFKEFVVNVSE